MGFIPDSMLKKADATVDHALETGGRSSTTINTDYGVIGDAFFKKAQLDMQIANLKADMGMRKAEMMSNLEIKKAELDLNARQLQINTGFKAAELKALAADRKVGFMEQLTGALGGAASGAMAGYSATGDAKGAMIGGAIGGGLTMMNYQQGGRRGGENAQRTLGHIADLSVQFKGMKDEQTQKDAWAGVLQTGKAITDQLNSARTPQERMAAMDQMEGYLGQVYATGMSMPNANPEKVGSMVSSMRTAMTSQAGLSDDPDKAAQQMKQLRTLVKYQSDERQNDPKAQRAWANDYMRETAADYEEAYGKTMPINMQRQAAYDLSPAVGQAFDKKLDGGAGSFGSIPSHARGTTRTQSSEDGEIGYRNRNNGNADGERTTSFHPSESGMPVEQKPFGQAGPGAIPFRNSVSMDDGGDFKPVRSEMELTDQAGDTVQAMDDITKGKMDAITPEEADDFDRDQSIFENKEVGMKERLIRGFQQGVPFADKIPLLAEGSTLDKMADTAENERLGREPEFSKVDAVARQKAYARHDIKDAESWRQEVNGLLDKSAPDKAPDVRAKNAVRDASYEVVRLENVLAKLPSGYLGELKSRAHAEGIGVEELATASLIVAGGVGGKALGTGAKAANAASKSVIFKKGGELFARIPKIGTVKVTEKTLTAIGVVSGGAAAKLANVAGLDQIDPNVRALTKGKKIGLSDTEAAAVDEFTQSVRDLAYANLMASSGKEPRVQELNDEIKHLMSLSDNPQSRWNKLSDMMDGLKDTARNMAIDFPGGGGSGGGGSKSSKSSAPRPGSAAWRAEKEAEFEWQQEKERRKGRSGKNGSFVPMDFYGN